MEFVPRFVIVVSKLDCLQERLRNSNASVHCYTPLRPRFNSGWKTVPECKSFCTCNVEFKETVYAINETISPTAPLIKSLITECSKPLKQKYATGFAAKPTPNTWSSKRAYSLRVSSVTFCIILFSIGSNICLETHLNNLLRIWRSPSRSEKLPSLHGPQRSLTLWHW